MGMEPKSILLRSLFKMKKEFSQEQIADIIKKYTKEYLSLRKISELYKVSRKVITRIIKENNISIRKTNHTYQASYNTFHIIDSAEKAYWLGFLAADGCIYKRENSSAGNFVVLNIHRKDRGQLEKFRDFMNSNAKIIDHVQNEGFSNNTPMSKIYFYSNQMVEDLICLGVGPRKSLTLKPPKIDPQYYLPFILGYFDGDGSIFKTQQNIFGIDFVGTKEILEWINDLLNISHTMGKRNPNDGKNNYYIRCGGTNKPYRILKQLYESVSTHLDRKFEIYQALETVVFNGNIK